MRSVGVDSDERPVPISSTAPLKTSFVVSGTAAYFQVHQQLTTPRTRYVHRELAGSRPWGSAVVAFSDAAEPEEIDAVRTRYGSTRFSMLGSTPGTVIVARVNFPGIGPITCISVYGAINVYAQTTMFRIVADLIPLFDSRDGARVVLGGDFNVTDAIRRNAVEFLRYRAI